MTTRRGGGSKRAEHGISVARPYAPSWIYAVDAALRRLPVPFWLTIGIVGLLVGTQSQLQAWENGSVPGGQLNVPSIYWTLLTIALLAAIGFFRRSAETAFDSFRPALTVDSEAADRLRYELSVIPAAGSWILLAATVALTAASFLTVPADAGIVGVSALNVAVAFLIQVALVATMFILGYQLVRQMRIVSRALASATVDPFLAGPLNALSRLTARTGITLVIIVASSALFVPPTGDLSAFILNYAPFTILPSIVAVIAFVVPLSGTHARLDAEKDRLVTEADLRLKGLLAEVNRDVDERDLVRADGLNKSLSSMLQQREVLAKLPTWPWSTTTLRAFVSAMLLPIVLFLIQRVLAQFV